MMYRIKLTPNAVEQIGSVVGYISNELHSPETALRWSDTISRFTCAICLRLFPSGVRAFHLA